jgi:hypothetical protein
MSLRIPSRWKWVLLLGLPVLGAGLYLVAAWMRSQAIGFPLDDAWIHQTFARSLAQRGEMAFNPGEPSAGSTSPLWTALLAPGHWLCAPVLWSYALAIGSLMLCGWLVWRLAEQLFPDQSALPWVASVTVLAEWHMAWSAVSGMETLLFTALGLALIHAYLSHNTVRRPLLPLGWGILGGLLCLARPEGVLLVGLVGLDLLRTRRWGDAIRMAGAWLVVTSPGFWLNWQATGSLLPDTFQAKLVYVAGAGWKVRLLFPLLAALAFWTGSLLVVLPISPWGAWRALRDDLQTHWLPVAWPLGLLALYTWRLPVLYHHARYLMPIVPWLALYGAAGLLRMRTRWRRFVLALHCIVLGIFWFQGANTYAWNVDNIQDQQVAIGEWVTSETPPDAGMAATDVGAIGYVSQRYVVDLEGLITPEINDLRRAGLSPVPFLRQQGVDFLVLYRDEDRPWLDELALTPVLTVTLGFNTISATGQMTVYRIQWDAP